MNMADPHGWTHLLLESGRLDNLQTPLRGSARLKFTCLSVSTRFIALGSNTGNVYIFDRNTQKHLQVVFPEVDPAAVNVVALCPNEKTVAFSTLNGHVIVMEMNVDKRARPERLKLVTEHMRTTVTCIQWEHSGGKIYVADSTGKVSTSVIPKVKNLVGIPADVIMRLESSVIQMDWSDNKLLVSTMTRAYLCSTIRQQYSQIGKKPREGEYGGCFYKLSKTSLPMMYCARPSSRVWEIDYEGNVLSTHQFKHLLAIPPIKVIDINEKEWVSTPPSDWAGQGINLPRLKMFGSQYLVSWRNNRVYILNPVKVKVILWTELDTGIKDLCTVKSDMYLFLTSGEVRRIQMFSVSQIVSILQKKNAMLAADLCCKFQPVLLKGKWRKHLSIERLQHLQQQVKGTDLELVFNNFMVELLKRGNNDDSDDDDDDSSESNRSRSSSSASVQSYTRVLNAGSRPSEEEAILDGADMPADGKSQEVLKDTEFPPKEDSQEMRYIDHHGAANGCHGYVDNAQSMSEEVCIEEEHTDFTHTQKSELDKDKVEKNNENEIDDGNLDNGHVLDLGDVLECGKERNGTASFEIPSALVSEDADPDGSVTNFTTEDEIDNALPDESQEAMQNDDDLAPVLAVSPAVEVSTPVGKAKKKRRVKTVDLGTPSKGNRMKPKGSKFGGGMKRSFSTSTIEETSKVKDSHTKSLSLDIYEDDIFSEDTGPSTTNTTSVQNVERGVDHGTSPSPDVNTPDDLDPAASVSSKPHSTTDRKIDRMTKVKSESDIAGKMSSHRKVGEDSRSFHNGEEKAANFSNSYDKKSVEFLSSTEKKLADLTSSLDSISTLGSSPSQSPLSLSWEGPSGGSSISTSPKVSLSSMKDSLQSKFSVTKRKLLKTIKEKTLLTKSTSHEDLAAMNLQSNSPAGEDLSTMESGPDKMKSGFDSIRESSCEQEQNLKPTVDLSQLIEKTTKTLKMLQDTTVVLNSESVMTTLREWVTQLNITLQALHTQLYRDKLARTAINTSSQVQDKDGSHEGALHEGEVQEEDRNEKIAEDPYNSDHDQWTENWSENEQTKEQRDDNDVRCTENKYDQSKMMIGQETKLADNSSQYFLCDEIAEQISDSIHSNDPFNLPADLFQNVVDLARICFQAECYGSVSKYSKPLTVKCDDIIDQRDSQNGNQIQMSEKQCKEEHSRICNPPELQTSIGDSYNEERTEAVLEGVENSTEAFVSQDEDVCNFIKNYCFLLDLSRVKDKLHGYSGNLFQLWCTYIKCLHEFYKKDVFFVKLINKEVHYAVEILRTGDYNGVRMLACVTKLFEENKVKALEFCQDSFHIQPLDVYFMCLYHSQSVSQYFSPYMYTRVNDVMATNRQYDTVYGHPLIRLKWLELLLVENRPTVELTDGDSLPRPRSHLVDWIKPECILSVLNSAEDDAERESFLDLVRSSGFWLGCLQLLQQLNRREEVLTTIIHLGDIGLFAEKYNYVPKSLQEWTFVVDLLYKQHQSKWSDVTSCRDRLTGTTNISQDSYDDITITTSGNLLNTENGENQDSLVDNTENTLHQKTSEPTSECLNDKGKQMSGNHGDGEPKAEGLISWDDIASLMLCHLGPVTAVTVLQDCDLRSGQMSSSFHRSALITMLLNRSKRNVTHNLLEKLDSYLWAKKPSTLMPELLYLMVQEKTAKGSHLTSSHRDKDSLIAYMPVSAQPCWRYQEDIESHWGINTKLTRNCLCCNLSLTEAVSHVEPGILSFQCGHVFHRLCVPEKICLLCGASSQHPTHV